MTIEIANAVLRFEHLQFAKPINWKISKGQHWAILGANGSGKTLLTDTLLGKYALKNGRIIFSDDNGNQQPIANVVKSVAFRDIYSIIDTQNSYYQQRWNKGDEQDVILVKDTIPEANQSWLAELVGWFGIDDLMQKEVNTLSSGELRKFLIVKSLLSKPRVLILDNPFIGLDAKSRGVLNDLFQRLADFNQLQIILVLSDIKDIPEIITDVIAVKEKSIVGQFKRNEFIEDTTLIDNLFNKHNNSIIYPLVQTQNEKFKFDNAILLKNISVSYGNRKILNGLDWQVKRGEKWALLGPNGSGKSTLLSLVCGDNPQAYANDITLFDRKRGTGESIWDIKKRIGYISPEMHLYYLKNVKCIDVVASGFFDTIGLYRKYNKEQEDQALEWMDIFGVKHIRDTSFLNTSSGEQRLILLARVFVKNPDLLILDEPLHGLDAMNKLKAKHLIESYCTDNKSLIYVTHYEDEIPDVVSKRLILSKNY